MRAVLLELSCGPAQLKQNGALYAKDEERVVASVSDLPDWLERPPHPAERVTDALERATGLRLIGQARRASKSMLEVGKRGSAWMSSPQSEQYASVYRDLAGLPKDDYWGRFGDHQFLGTSLAVMVTKSSKPAKRQPYPDDIISKSDPMQLRRALLAAFSTLTAGTFYTVSSVLDYLTDPARNPLLLGQGVNDVAIVTDQYHIVFPLEEVVEATARQFLLDFIHNRLWPLGCVRLGRAGDVQLLAVTPRLPLYFDPTQPFPESAAEEARVVVQPDFSVLVIGLNAAPAAELAAFATRDRSSNTPGAVTLRLTREDAMRGLHAGLTADEMIARLRRHAATGVPANVETQLRTWTGQGRVVTAGPLLVLRCPDEETAGRVMSAIGKKAERLGPTCVGFAGKINSALRQKFLAQGVLLREESQDE
jgi:hypothetical protein